MRISANFVFESIFIIKISAVLFSINLSAESQEATLVTNKKLEVSLWAKEPILKNPVALSFDNQGKLYVVETARRSTVDIDIRAHKEWIIDDLANQSVDDLRHFFRTKMAPELSEKNAPWLKDLNQDGIHDWRDLMQVKERVHLLVDSNGDGAADKAQVFFEGFNEEINGVVAGIMPNEKDVLVTIYPDLWRLRDNDGDGVADEKESLFRGFGVHAAFDGHDIHGLTWGPDGKIYFSVGDNGFSVINKEGKKLHYPNTGGVLRMDPDYSNLEVFAYGLRNVQEIAFDKYGNLFSVDNDGDLEDERERFVYITEGSDSGWRLNWQFRTKGWAKYTEQPDYNPWTAGGMWKPYFKGQPAHITPPLSNYSVGPGGFKYNPGTALNDQYKDFFFCVQFPVKKITAFKAKPKGAYFKMIDEHVFHSGLMASAVNFSPNGGIYIADWDGMWSPNDRGAIYKMDDPLLSSHPIREQVKQILHDGPERYSIHQLLNQLKNPDQRVRLQAQFELVRRNEINPMLNVAVDKSANQLARIHSLWGISQAKGKGISKLDEELPFSDDDPEIRAQAAKVAGELKIQSATNTLIQLLNDQSPRVQFFAALALGKCGNNLAIGPLLDLLEKNNGEDAFIRHACVMGLIGIGDIESLVATSNHPSTAVRIGAILALRRLKSSKITAFLSDPDVYAQREAASAIHDDFSIPPALPGLAQRLNESDLPNDEAIIRRAISSNLRLGQEYNATRLIQYASNTLNSASMRIEALESLADWNNQPFLDRVEGRVRQRMPSNPKFADEILTKYLPQLLTDTDEYISAAASQIASERNLEIDEKILTKWIRSPEKSDSIRSGALVVLDKRNAKNITSLVNYALSSEAHQLRIMAWGILSERNIKLFLSKIDRQFWDLPLIEQQNILQILSSLDNPKAIRLLQESLERLIKKTLPKELQLDVLEAVNGKQKSSFIFQLTNYKNSLEKDDPLSKYRPALFGGDKNKGKDIYTNHVSAQCIRCHDAGGKEKQVGPPLDGIGSKFDREYILQSLIDPNAIISKGFETIAIELKDDEFISGKLEDETTEELTLRIVSGKLVKIDKSKIKFKERIKTSSMPPMGAILKPKEIRNLVEYLASKK